MKQAEKMSKLDRLKSLFILGSMDIGFLAIVLVLLCVGIVMMFSASYVNAIYTAGSAYHYFIRQLVFGAIGIVFMLIASVIDVKIYKKLGYFIMAAALFLLVLVLIVPYQMPGKEEFKRWLGFGGFSFQPSEIAKFAIIVFCAKILSTKDKFKRNNRDYSRIICFAMGVLVCGLIFFEKHLSCMILILGIVIIMMILGGMDSRIVTLGIIAVVAVYASMLIFDDFIVRELPENRVTLRIISWLDKDYTSLGERWQTNQSLYAIGSGGLFGLGLGNSKQKHLYMPEPQNDFIFAIICEELGFIGAVGIILLFALLIWRGFVIAMRARKRFSALLAMGLMAHIGLQTIINILVVTDTFPNTGISLPFFSYGGTALIMQLAEMGVVLAVSRESNLKK